MPDPLADASDRIGYRRGSVLLDVVVGVLHPGDVRRGEVALPAFQNRNVPKRRVFHAPNELDRLVAQRFRSLVGEAFEHRSSAPDLAWELGHTAARLRRGLRVLVGLED